MGTMAYGERCPECAAWIETPGHRKPDGRWLVRHRAKHCPGRNAGWTIPEPEALYVTTQTGPGGLDAAHTVVLPGPLHPAGGVALPDIFNPPEITAAVVPGYDDGDDDERRRGRRRMRSWEEREQDELWAEAHLDVEDRRAAQEVERALWRTVAGIEEAPPMDEVEDVGEDEPAGEADEGEEKPRKRKKRETAVHGISKEVIESSDEDV
jgi:hypothetical protein